MENMNESRKAVFFTDLILPIQIVGEVISVRPAKAFFDGTSRLEVEIEFKTDGTLKTQSVKAKTGKGVTLELGKIYNLHLQLKKGRVRESGTEKEFHSFSVTTAVEKKGGAK